MSMRVLASAIWCIMTVVASTRALAQEMDEAEKQNGRIRSRPERPQRPLWEASVETTWLPGSRIHGIGGNLALDDVTVGFARRFRIGPRFALSTGSHYSFWEIAAPEAARLPEALHALSVALGGEYRASDRLTLGIGVAPGLGSDFRSFATSDVRVAVSLHAGYQVSEALSLLGGIADAGQNRSLPVLPVIGVLYLPSERWGFALAFPRAGVVLRPNKETELFAAGEFSGGEVRLHDSSIGARIMSYRDYRALVGAEIRLLPFARLGISGGYAFARHFTFPERNRSDVSVDGAPFGRVAVKFTR